MAETLIGIKPLHSRILVGIYDDGDTTMQLGGKTFYLLDDSSATKERDIHTKHQGVRPRYAMVLSTSDQVQKTGEVKPGDKVLLDQLTWSRGMKANLNKKTVGKVWSIKIEDVLGVIGDDKTFTESDRQQLTRLYPDWEEWTTREI